MGRPINKKFLGNGANKIEVTEVKFSGGGTNVAEAHIVRQRSAHKFEVSDGTTTEVVTLVNKLPGTLGISEFVIEVVDAAGDTFQATKLRNRTLQIEGSTNVKWSSNTDGTTTTVELAITAITLLNPLDITMASTAALTTGDKVSIKDIVGTVELNVDTGFTITVVDATSITLNGVNGTVGHTAWVSGGIVTKAGTVSGGIVIDRQNV